MGSEDSVTLRRITADEAARWDVIAQSSPHGTIFHTWAWVSAIAKHSWINLFGERITPIFHPLIAEHNGRDIALIPLYEFRGRFLNYVFSPPQNSYLTYLGPCLNFPPNLKQSEAESLHRKFHNATDEYLKGIGAHCVCIHTPPGYDDMRPYLWLGYDVTPLYNYILDLRTPLGEILEKSRSDFKKQLKKSEKEGYVVSEGSFKDVERLFQQHSERYAEQGIQIPITLAYLKDLWDGMGLKGVRIIKAELNGEYVSASIQTLYKCKVSAWFGNPKNTLKGRTPNDLLNWATIKWAANNGYSEFEEIWANEERLNGFKTKLNPRLNYCYSVVWMSAPLKLAYAVRKFLFGGKIWGAGL